MIVDSPGWPAGKGPELGHYIDELWFTTPTTFWGWFGRVNVPLPEPLVDVLTISCLLLLAVGLFRRRATIRTVLVFASPVVLTAVLFLRVSWGAYVDTTVVRGLHGRYFFTVVLALIVLAAIAVANVVERPGPRRVLGIRRHRSIRAPGRRRPRRGLPRLLREQPCPRSGATGCTCGCASTRRCRPC